MDNDEKTPYKPPFRFRLSDGMDRSTISSGVAETLEGAIQGAFELNRYQEAPVKIIDNRGDEEVVLGTLRIDWVED